MYVDDAFIVGWTDVESIILNVEVAGERLTRMPLPAKFVGPGETDLQSWQGIECETKSIPIGVGRNARVVDQPIRNSICQGPSQLSHGDWNACVSSRSIPIWG